jgi:murein DD-endopeptidase MepM/ murein hydrolase activator NlpD
MALPALVVPTTRIGKAVLVGAFGSACVAVMLSSLKPGLLRPDDDLTAAAGSSPVSPVSPDVDARRTTRSDVASVAPKVPAEPSGPLATSVTIDSSFAQAMRRLGVDERVTALLVRSFAGEIDFRRDLRKGDTVSLVMPPPTAAHAAQSTKVAEHTGAVPLAVRISRGDADHDLFLRRDLRGKPFYYTADGQSALPSFDRYPLAFTRVSSNFAARRLDPVTHQWQSHDGVDFAAPMGTPVHATARGAISYIGWETGYGRIVVIDNVPPYQTAFAHLSRFAKGLHRGSRVRRGQVIGYVGRTGWATGPHLHYEVRVADVARNPLTVTLPGDTPLRGNERTRFVQRANRLAALL